VVSRLGAQNLSPLRLPVSPPGLIQIGLVEQAGILWEVTLKVNRLLPKSSKGRLFGMR
jgi:hypothetical protein